MTRVCLQFVNVAFPDLARRGAGVCLQFVIVVFPDQTHFTILDS